MMAGSYEDRRAKIEQYFDRTAADAWTALTSDAPVSRIRQTVRAGRDTMRGTLLSWLPEDLGGRRVLDAGCGTGAFAVEAARRGAAVVAIDLSETLVALARERSPAGLAGGVIDFRVGDMSRLEGERFDYAVAMDSVIHYDPDHAMDVLGRLAGQVDESILFTFAPKTPLLAVMHAVGAFFPRGNRAPSIEPISERQLYRDLDRTPELAGWRRGRERLVKSGFYTSKACELRRREIEH